MILYNFVLYNRTNKEKKKIFEKAIENINITMSSLLNQKKRKILYIERTESEIMMIY